jgi:hypothetical protein
MTLMHTQARVHMFHAFCQMQFQIKKIKLKKIFGRVTFAINSQTDCTYWSKKKEEGWERNKNEK